MGNENEQLEARLVELLGLDRWWCGVNTFRIGTPSGKVAKVWMDCLWTFEGWPSFAEWWWLVGVSATSHKTPPTLERVGWLPWSDVFAPNNAVTSLGVSANLTFKSFREAVNSIRLLAPSQDPLTLDGITYKLDVRSLSNDGRVDFGNPYRADLIGVESAAFMLARELQEATGSEALRVCLETWDQYRASPGGGN